MSHHWSRADPSSVHGIEEAEDVEGFYPPVKFPLVLAIIIGFWFLIYLLWIIYMIWIHPLLHKKVTTGPEAQETGEAGEGPDGIELQTLHLTEEGTRWRGANGSDAGSPPRSRAARSGTVGSPYRFRPRSVGSPSRSNTE